MQSTKFEQLSVSLGTLKIKVRIGYWLKNSNKRQQNNQKRTSQTLVFVHGNSASKEAFKYIFSDPIFTNFNLLAFDLPGHGDSTHIKSAHRNSHIYSMEFYGKTIREFLIKMKIKNPILIGHSLGGHIATFTSSIVPISGLFTFQAPPLQEASDLGLAFQQAPGVSALFTDKIIKKDTDLLMKLFFPNSKIPAHIRSSFLTTDPLCRKNLVTSLCEKATIGEVSYLNKLRCPVFLLFGLNDLFLKLNYLRKLQKPSRKLALAKTKQIRIKRVKNFGHYPQIENVKAFNQVLLSFVKKIK